MRQSTARFFLSEPERNASFSELNQSLVRLESARDVSPRAVIDTIFDAYSAEHSENFWYSLESALEYILLPHIGPVQARCEVDAQGAVAILIFRPTSTAFVLVPPRIWMPRIQPESLLLFFEDSYRQRGTSSLYLSTIVGSDAKGNLLLGGDRISGSGSLAAQPMTLPRPYLAFLDDVPTMTQFLVTVFDDISSGSLVQRASRSHAAFLRDLAIHAGLNPLSAVINASSGLLILDKSDYAKRHWIESCSWIRRNANLRSLHVTPPVPRGLSVRARIRYACNVLARVKVTDTDIYLPSPNNPDKTVRLYAKNDKQRKNLVGPWSGTLRLLSRYAGAPILVCPDSMRPFI